MKRQKPWTQVPLIAGLALFLLFWDCGGGGNMPTPTQTPSGSPVGVLSISPSAMNFGNVVVTNSQAETGNLVAGGSAVKVSSATWKGAGFSLAGITFPTTIAARQSLPFTISFAPQTGGTVSGTVSFLSDASNSPTSEALSGTGIHEASLTWNPSTSSIVGYYVYRGTQSGGPYVRLNASPVRQTGYNDQAVLPGATYYYLVTAVDSKSVESQYSQQVMAVIPTP